MGNCFSIQLSCDTVINRCWDCVAAQAIDRGQLEEDLADLKRALGELKDRRSDVLREVNVAEKIRNLKPLDEVRGWLSRSETMINEVENFLVDGPNITNKLCMGGCFCKNYKSTLDFSKTVAKRLHDVKDLKTSGSFDEVAVYEPATKAIVRPSDSAVGLESVLEQVWESFEEKPVGIIGLYGTGGVGKTRLLTEINNKIDVCSGGFDVVIWAVVSRGFSTENLQDEIAKSIGLLRGMWDDKTPEDKAIDIFRVLKEKKFVLLLDDIWERVDLSKVGIPIPTPENSSKLIFTTRSIEVCGQMRAHKKIKVQCLPEDKAWELFEEYVDNEILDNHPNIRELAQEVAKECGGLPLALITIGRAMACKNTVEEWKYAIEVLKRSANFVFPEMSEEVYPLLKFSFDSLPNDVVRLCLLYCSLFLEDQLIPKERLIDCWIGEGFLDEYENSTSQARNQGYHLIGSLIHACLLEEVNDFFIKMHDVIRDMSLWIACSCEAEKWRFYVQAGYHLTQMPETQKWRCIRRMSLMNNKIKSLTEAPNCPDLQTLFLDKNKQLKVIHNDFFQFMCHLKVLSLRQNIGIIELPVGISKLVFLEHLDLSGTKIKKLPIELKALKNLKYLNLDRIFDCIKIPRGLISSFYKLQVLRMFESYPFMEEEMEDNCTECLAEELQSLNHLNLLTVSVQSAFALDRFLCAKRLYSSTEWIGLHFFKESNQLNVLSLVHLNSLRYIQLRDCESLEELETEFGSDQFSTIAGQPCFQSLSNVVIMNCSRLRDISWLILAPNLTHLCVVDCCKMEEIINEIKLSQVAAAVGTLCPFAKLKFLRLWNLQELKSIYCSALPFSCMEKIEIRECPMLKGLPVDSNSAKGNKISIYGEEIWWKELQWQDESTQNAFLPSFTAL